MIQVEVGTITLSAISLMLLSALLGYAFGIRRIKFQAKHNAAIEFKQVVKPLLDKLESGENQFNTIQDSFENHIRAAVTFSAHLKGKELKSFESALNEYRHWQNTIYGGSTAEIMYDTEDPEYLEEKAKDPMELIKGLLKYANT
jgi:hypothetical protein